jgi:hypothetical protein
LYSTAQIVIDKTEKATRVEEQIHSLYSLKSSSGASKSGAGVDAVFQRAAGFEDAGMAERVEEAVTEDLRLALLVALDVLTGEVDELGDARRDFAWGFLDVGCH